MKFFIFTIVNLSQAWLGTFADFDMVVIDEVYRIGGSTGFIDIIDRWFVTFDKLLSLGRKNKKT